MSEHPYAIIDLKQEDGTKVAAISGAAGEVAHPDTEKPGEIHFGVISVGVFGLSDNLTPNNLKLLLEKWVNTKSDLQVFAHLEGGDLSGLTLETISVRARAKLGEVADRLNILPWSSTGTSSPDWSATVGTAIEALKRQKIENFGELWNGLDEAWEQARTYYSWRRELRPLLAPVLAIAANFSDNDLPGCWKSPADAEVKRILARAKTNLLQHAGLEKAKADGFDFSAKLDALKNSSLGDDEWENFNKFWNDAFQSGVQNRGKESA